MFALFAEASDGLMAWPPTTVGGALIASLLFGLLGIALAIFGFKAFDWLTPGDLQDEILKKNNVAAAILAGALLVGICIVVASAVG